ncbi:hypothetical protein SteCoe_26842 [Stentor coeruleus]|uniref:Uncharacterized protein n=1 Tax=Stentor coeruleus TaxID=5963 RepID=A0A1R2BBZ4_9CILI|nr:hypothetical protein SteCoe_26842 [Stentor coeruleus]
MANYKKPAKLVPLNFYSPYQTYRENRRLISRDRNVLSNKFYGSPETTRETSVPLLNTCVRSFMWMYRSPGHRITSFHEEHALGKDRHVKLKPLPKVPGIPIPNGQKQVLTRKPTISMHRIEELDLKNSIMTESILKGNLTLTSGMIIKGKESLMIPFKDLKDFLFVPEGELVYNLSLSLSSDSFGWRLGKGLYSNYSDVVDDFASPFYLPSMQISFFLVKSKAVYGRQLGKIIKDFECKGLTMKLFRYLNGNTPDILMAWEGCEAKIVTKKIADSFETGFFQFLSLEEAKKHFTEEDKLLLDDYILPSITFNHKNQYYKFIYPKVMYSANNKIYPVPLGLLKQMIEKNFTGWAETWTKRFDYIFPLRRAGQETCTLKSNINFKDQPCVLTLNSYELAISNNELEASFAFKISDLEYIFKHLGPDLIPSLAQQAKLIQKQKKNRLVWDLSIEIHNLPLTKGETPSTYSVKIDKKTFKCLFTTPWVELYKPHTGETLKHPLSNSEISKIIENDFGDWEKLVLKLFT